MFSRSICKPQGCEVLRPHISMATAAFEVGMLVPVLAAFLFLGQPQVHIYQGWMNLGASRCQKILPEYEIELRTS